MAAPGLSELITHTQRNRPARVTDLMSKNNGLFYKLKKMKRVKLEDGGRTLVRELEYQENSTFMYYDGYETINVAPTEILSAAEYEWKQASVFVSIDGKTKRINNGKNRVVDIYKTRIANAERTLVNNLAVDLYSDGTGSAGKQIGGLQLLVATDPTTGTVGGIDRASWTFWRNLSFDFSTSLSAVASSSNIQAGMNRVQLQTQRQSKGDRIDLWVYGDDYYEYFWSSLTPLQRFGDSEEADLGFQTLKHVGADVICDGGIGGGIASGTKRGYGLCTKYLDFTVHAQANFEQLGGKREPNNQDAEGVMLGAMCNMTMSNALVQSVLKD